jgi:hypothetical protein
MESDDAKRTAPTASRPYIPGYGIAEATQGEGLLPWTWAVERLTAAHNYWLATTAPGGAPHLMPVWGIWQDGAFRFSTGAGSRKARNFRADPPCVVSTERADETVILEGEVETFSDAAVVRAFLDAYNAKYAWNMDASFGPFHLVRPHVAFGFIELAGRFSATATRWRFAAPRTAAPSPHRS